MPHTCQVEWQSLCLRMRGRMRRKSASGPDRIRHQCVSCYSPSLASWCIIFYERPKGTTFYWRCGRAGLECDALAGSRGKGRASDSRGLRRGYALLDLGLRKMHPCRGIIAWRAILSDESDESDGSDGANNTGCVSGRDLPPRVPIPQGGCVPV